MKRAQERAKTYERPPVSRKVGGVAGHNLSGAVSAKDNLGWVFVATDQQAQRKIEGMEETELPDWDSFITLDRTKEGESDGGSQDDEMFESADWMRSVARSVPASRSVGSRTEEIQIDEIGGKAQARIHRTGSVDILLPKRASPRRIRTSPAKDRPMETHSNLSQLGLGARTPVLRGSILGTNNVEQARSVEKFFKKQQVLASNFKSPERIPQGNKLREKVETTKVVEPSRTKIFDTLLGETDELESNSDKNAKRPMPRRYDHDLRVEDSSKVQSPQPPVVHSKQLSREEPESDVKFWEARSRRRENSSHKISTVDPDAWESNFRRGNPRYTERVDDAVEWLIGEIERVSSTLSSGHQLLSEQHFSVGELQKLFEAAEHPHDQYELLTLAKRLEVGDSLLLQALPRQYKEYTSVFKLWKSLEGLIYEWYQRDRHHRNVRKESILSVHNSIQSLHKQAQKEKLDQQREMAEKIRLALERCEVDHSKSISSLENKLNRLEGELLEEKNKAASLAQELSESNNRADAALRRATSAEIELERTKELQLVHEERNNSRQGAQLEHLRKVNKSLEAQLATKEKSQAQELEQLRLEVVSTRDRLTLDKNGEVSQLRQKHEAYRVAIESKLNQLVAEHRGFVSELEAKHRDSLNALHREHTMQLEMARRATREMEGKLLKAKEEHKLAVESLKSEYRIKEDGYVRALERARKSQSRTPVKPSHLNLKAMPAEIDLDTGSESPPPPPPPPLPPPPPASLLSRMVPRSTSSMDLSETSSPMVSALLGIQTDISRRPRASSMSSQASAVTSRSVISDRGKVTTFTDLLDRYIET